MPTNRRRRRPGRRGDASSPRIIAQLLDGHDWEFLDHDLGEDLDPELLASAWAELGEDLVDYWVFASDSEAAEEFARIELGANPRAPRPGTRPWGWWAHTAPENRRVISGTPHENDGLPYGRFLGRGLGFEPAGNVREFRFGLPRHCWSTTKVEYESQYTYLLRHRLLLPGEVEALAAIS